MMGLLMIKHLRRYHFKYILGMWFIDNKYDIVIYNSL